MSRERVQAIALGKKVPFLIHFTRAENIASIMAYGLLPVSVAREQGIRPTINDPHRLDGRLNGTSLSVSFPNGAMFYKLRNENPDSDWVVLALSPSILWSKNVLFCQQCSR